MGRAKQRKYRQKRNRLPSTPDYWIQVIFPAPSETQVNIPWHGDRDGCNYRAFTICKYMNPPVDMVLILDGKADPANPSPDQILSDLRPYPFVAAGEVAQFAG